jgi:hypothetical protein
MSPIIHSARSRIARRFIVPALVLIAIAYFFFRSPTHLSNYLPSSSGGKHVNGPKTWFIGTITPAHASARRQLIRESWQKMYRSRNIFTTKFVLSNPGEALTPAIQRENATYGDLIVLGHLEETAEVANSVKSIEFLKYLVNMGEKYEFVSKVDDDSFLDAWQFYKEYLRPILNEEEGATHKDKKAGKSMNGVSGTQSLFEVDDGPRSIIGKRTKETIYNFAYPGGQFYTLSWDMAQLLAKAHDKNPFSRERYEDVLIGRLLFSTKEEWYFTEVDNVAAFDFTFSDESRKQQQNVWAQEDDDFEEYEHAIGPGSINPHRLKDEHLFLKVAACWDENGMLKTPPM